MFIKYLLNDIIILKPNEIISDNNLFLKLIRSKLREKYINKVIVNIGICIEIKEFYIYDSKITDKEADLLFNFDIELICFYSFQNELLEGKLAKINNNGIELICFNFSVFIGKEDMMDNTY